MTSNNVITTHKEWKLSKFSTLKSCVNPDDWVHHSQPRLSMHLHKIYTTSQDVNKRPDQFLLKVVYTPLVDNAATQSFSQTYSQQEQQNITLLQLDLNSFSDSQLLERIPQEEVPIRCIYRTNIIGIRYAALVTSQTAPQAFNPFSESQHQKGPSKNTTEVEYKRFQARFFSVKEAQEFTQAIRVTVDIKPANENIMPSNLKKRKSGEGEMWPSSTQQTSTKTKQQPMLPLSTQPENYKPKTTFIPFSAQKPNQPASYVSEMLPPSSQILTHQETTSHAARPPPQFPEQMPDNPLNDSFSNSSPSKEFSAATVAQGITDLLTELIASQQNQQYTQQQTSFSQKPAFELREPEFKLPSNHSLLSFRSEMPTDPPPSSQHRSNSPTAATLTSVVQSNRSLIAETTETSAFDSHVSRVNPQYPYPPSPQTSPHKSIQSGSRIPQDRGLHQHIGNGRGTIEYLMSLSKEALTQKVDEFLYDPQLPSLIVRLYEILRE